MRSWQNVDKSIVKRDDAVEDPEIGGADDEDDNREADEEDDEEEDEVLDPWECGSLPGGDRVEAAQRKISMAKIRDVGPFRGIAAGSDAAAVSSASPEWRI